MVFTSLRVSCQAVASKEWHAIAHLRRSAVLNHSGASNRLRQEMTCSTPMNILQRLTEDGCQEGFSLNSTTAMTVRILTALFRPGVVSIVAIPELIQGIHRDSRPLSSNSAEGSRISDKNHHGGNVGFNNPQRDIFKLW